MQELVARVLEEPAAACNGTTWACTLGERSASLVLVACLVAIGVLFEIGKDLLEEHVSKASRPVVHALEGELMVGGYIGLVSWVLLRYNALGDVSKSLFPDEESTYLGELLEMLHAQLFLLFAFFLLQVLLLIAWSHFFRKGWKAQERALRAGAASEFAALRSEFIKPVASQPLPHDFDFASYLGMAMGVTIARLVAIPPTIWIVALCMFFYQWFLQGWSSEVQVVLFVCLGYFLLAVSAACWLKLRRIYATLLPAASEHAAAELEDAPLLAALERQPPPVRSLPVRARSALGRLLLGPPPTRLESLFPLGRPALLLRTLSAIQFSTAVYVAIYVFWFCAFAVSEFAVAPLLIVVAILPALGISVVVVPRTLQLFVLSTHVEELRSMKLVQKTLLTQRTKRTVRAVRLLQALRMGSAEQAEAEGEEHAEAREHGAVNRVAEPEDDLRQLFATFDNDGNGVLDADELKALMRTLGHCMSSAQLDDMVHKLDQDGTGAVSYAEWARYMGALAATRRKGPMDEEEVAEVFRFFDKGNTGTIEVSEFAATFASLGHALSPDELHEFVREIDGDGGGVIDLEEFAHFLKQYSE